MPDVTVFFHESVQQLTVEQIMHVPLPQFLEDVVEVIQTFPPDLLFQRIVLQIVDALVLQVEEQVVEVESACNSAQWTSQAEASQNHLQEHFSAGTVVRMTMCQCPRLYKWSSMW